MRTIIYTLILSCICCLATVAQCGNFVGADYSQGIVFIMENNRIVWQHKAPESNDIWVLPNGNLLFSTGKGVLEITVRTIPFFIILPKVRSLPASG